MFKYIVSLFIIFLSSCKVGEEYNLNSVVNYDEAAKELSIVATKDRVSENWYTIFNDKDLNTLITTALNNNYTIKQGIERLQQSRYSYLVQSKNYYPQVDASADYNYNKTNNLRVPQKNTNIFQAGFDASWEIDIWGKGDYISKQYEELMNEAQYSLANIKVSIISEIISNYISLREKQEKLRIVNKNLFLQKETLQTIKDKYNAGITDDLSLNQAKYTVESTKAIIPQLKIEIENDINSIAVLLGTTPSGLSINLNKFGRNIVSSPFKYSVSNLYKLPLNIIHTRPDVLKAEALVKEKNALVNEAIASLYPSLSLISTFGYISSSGHSLFDTNSQNYGYTPALTLPIWHWQQLQNNVEIQKHIREEYLSIYNETLLTAISELKTAIISVEQEYKRHQILLIAQSKMQNILDLTKEKYKNGLVDFTEVTRAEQNLLQAQLDTVESQAQFLQSFLSFYKSTGGGFNFQPCK